MSSYSHSDNSAAVMHGEFMAFAMDNASCTIIREWAERQGYPSATVQQGGADFFSQMLETAAPPKIAIVDIDGQSDPAGVTSRLVGICGTEAKIIVIGGANDVSLYRRLISTGIVDYLVKPLSSENLTQALAMALRNGSAANPEIKQSKTIVFIGSRGGVGTSTAVVNTGWFLSHTYKYNCVLLDLDMQFGTTSLALDLEPGRGLRDIVSSPLRVDGLMIASSLAPESDQLSVLGAEEHVDEHMEIDGAAIAALLKEMKSNFDFTLVDLPRHLLASQKRLIAGASHIMLVTELSLSGIRDTLRIKTAITSLGYTGKISIIVSRADLVAGQMSQATFEKAAQTKIDLIIPEDNKSVAQAANLGKALAAVAHQSPTTKALKMLANMIGQQGTDTAEPKKKNGLLANLFGSKKKAAKKVKDK